MECGGPNRLICDTGEWTESGSRRTDSGWLDVKVMIEIFGDYGAGEMVELVLSNAFYYYGTDHNKNPMLLGVSPRAASAEGALTLTGNNLGYWMQDYRMVYVGTGRAPQGGNVVTALTATATGALSVLTVTTHVQCRPGELNSIRDPLRPDTPAVTTAAVMQEDRNAAPIATDEFMCGLGDFMVSSWAAGL